MPLLQVLATCLKEVTLMVCEPPSDEVLPEAVALEAELALDPLPDAVPVTCTSCPTWLASFEVSPARV